MHLPLRLESIGCIVSLMIESLMLKIDFLDSFINLISNSFAILIPL